ncbi:11656_t:CDS:2 [Acaulospora morrowiae]|uniref:11656_t:CDS:1 n=1 Tax=Acaulospora morrowiae TaxID=94023 RepID=A0A9N8Z7N9_9GLOM|nr:11656_t:CDS:2 [Acaulospora morrowiae]
MEVKPTKRVNEPKHLRRKVVFVDPDDPEAPHWWPALVVPLREIEIFKQKMDSDVQYPREGENLVCYFEDGSYSIVSEKDQLPFDPNSEPYTTYMEGPNVSIFQRDKAVTLATLYFEKGAVPPSFKWLRNEDSGNASDSNGDNLAGTNESNNAGSVGSDVAYNTGDEDGIGATPEKNNVATTKRHPKKDSSNNELSNSNKKDVISKRDNNVGQRKDNSSSQGKKNPVPVTSTPGSRNAKVKPRSFSGSNKSALNNPTNNNSTSSKPILNTNSTFLQPTNKSVNNLSSSTHNNNANNNTSNQQSHQLSAAERVITSRTKQCFQCGEKTTTRTANNNDNKEPCSKLLCGDCGELLNLLLNPSFHDSSSNSNNSISGDEKEKITE